jgi:hypothetical protein
MLLHLSARMPYRARAACKQIGIGSAGLHLLLGIWPRIRALQADRVMQYKHRMCMNVEETNLSRDSGFSRSI